MKPEAVLQALLAIWDQLPAFVGQLAQGHAALEACSTASARGPGHHSGSCPGPAHVSGGPIEASGRDRSRAGWPGGDGSADRSMAPRRTTRGVSDFGRGGGVGGPAVAPGPSLAVLADRSAAAWSGLGRRDAGPAEPAQAPRRPVMSVPRSTGR